MAPETPPSASDDGIFDTLHRAMLSTFRRHAAVFVLVLVGLVVARVALGGAAWPWWPLYAWGLLVVFQFFYVRSASMDDAWVEERVADLQVRSYDLGHMEDIRTRMARRDSSVRPSDERDEPQG